MQDRQFAGGLLVPLRYTIRERLAQIGDPATTTYRFSARYAYRPNGTVSEAEFYNAGSPATAKRYKYTFGTGSYDALNRLKSADFSSWEGSAWTSTLAHDLAGITYDLAGNLTALQRYRETATLLDNLTYAYPAGSNRLSSITDAVGATAEAWDAETGAFTYDPNGNVATAPAPYTISAVTYDQRNLPTSLTRGGQTITFRYDETGQRVTKRVGGGDTELYVRDGPATLAVFTVDAGGTPTSWYFNLVAGDKVIGRQPSVGDRRHYHADLLGSSRAVTDTGVILESYDFEPWGLLMPGRTLGSGTKEGFTGKEQDVETGLDYFGARYYMPALARWTSPDPLGEKHPEWSPYNYVLNNPLVLIDPDGQQVSANDPARFFQRAPLRPGVFLGAAAPAVLQAEVQGGLLAASLLPVGRFAGGVISTLGDIATGNFGVRQAALNFLFAGRGRALEEASGLAKTAERLGSDAAQTASLGERASAIHGLVPARTQNATTIAVTQTAEGTRVVSSSERRLRPAQRAALRPGEVEGVGAGHAEVTGVNAARGMGLTPTATGASRPICPECAKFLEKERVRADGP